MLSFGCGLQGAPILDVVSGASVSVALASTGWGTQAGGAFFKTGSW